jgi:hypothetical protein
MKKNLLAHIGRSAITRLFLMLIVIAFSSTSLYAQSCLGSSLNINTGEGGHPTSPFSVLPGNPDPAWNISFRGGSFGGGPFGFDALVVNTDPGWGTIAGGGQWISDNQVHANPGIATTAGSIITFSRNFRICNASDITFDMLIRVDNYVQAIRVDGVAVPGMAQAWWWPGGPDYYSNFNAAWHPVFTLSLAAGAHTLEIQVNDEQGAGQNPVGLLVKGSINAPTSTIVLDAEPGCDTFKCVVPRTCEDRCYWKVEGNNILNNNNIFGTLTNHDVRIVTNNPGAATTTTNDRGIITNDGLLGWNLTPTNRPTALFDVRCNTSPYTAGASDIRFRSLQTSSNVELTTLAIDPLGYVFRTNVPLNGGNKWDLLGNTITSSNFMGTINNEDIRFNTYTSGSSPFSNSQRMVIKGSSSGTQNDPMAGFVGVNTASPTARFHVNCANGNTQASGISDIRFQALETKNDDQLTLLAIDHAGYVYNTGQPISGSSSTAWDINGNATPANNKFGITTPGQNIMIHNGSPATNVGIIDQFGNWGWNLSGGLPTTYLHLDAAGPNVPPMGSGVRFEHLQSNDGDILVIDQNGYVYTSGINIKDVVLNGGGDDGGMMKRKVDELEKQVTELKNMITNSSKTDKITPVSGNELYQNNPNPFGVETSIGYNIVRMQQSAFVAIYDLNGRELYRYAVTAKGKGSVTVSGDKLVPGQYLYSLIVDGREEATKKMVVSK